MPNAELDANIRAYEEQQTLLEAQHNKKWVIFANNDLVDVYDSLDEAVRDGIAKFGRKSTYLIRNVGQSTPCLSATVMPPCQE